MFRKTITVDDTLHLIDMIRREDNAGIDKGLRRFDRARDASEATDAVVAGLTMVGQRVREHFQDSDRLRERLQILLKVESESSRPECIQFKTLIAYGFYLNEGDPTVLIKDVSELDLTNEEISNGLLHLIFIAGWILKFEEIAIA